MVHLSDLELRDWPADYDQAFIATPHDLSVQRGPAALAAVGA